VGEFGGERGWKTDIIIIATIVGLISVAMFWYYETVRMEDVKEQRNDALEQMLKHHNDLIANFTDVAMAVLRIAEPAGNSVCGVHQYYKENATRP
jgi:hypothetical protein